MSVCNNPSSCADDPNPIYVINADIFQSHILNRLDGVSIAFTSCVSSLFRSLCNNDELWRDICNSTWPSTTDPLVRSALSSLHRSFYYDSFPSIVKSSRLLHQNTELALPETLISAVDIYYDKEVIYSKAMETETRSDRFLNSIFEINILDRVEQRTVPLPRKFKLNQWIGAVNRIEACALRHLRVSWKLFDRTKNRAVNVAGRKPVKLGFSCLFWTKDEDKHEWSLPYFTVVADGGGNMVEFVVLFVWVLRGRKVHVKEVSLYVVNMEGKLLTGKDSLGILLSAMDGQKRILGRKMEKAIYNDLRRSWSYGDKYFDTMSRMFSFKDSKEREIR